MLTFTNCIRRRPVSSSPGGTAPRKGICAFKTHTGTKSHPVTEGCEIDHLISRELGGVDTIKNLWPQPYTQNPGAHEKHWLENELHKEVWAGTITLQDAQQEIKVDWYDGILEAKALSIDQAT